jgi:5-methylcytosine-specific restriction endonuclease McrA
VIGTTNCDSDNRLSDDPRPLPLNHEGRYVSLGTEPAIGFVTEDSLDEVRRGASALSKAIDRQRSRGWQLRLWSKAIKMRDGFRCLCCDGTERIQAHHIIRKSLFPAAQLDLGNGITLCSECHARVHAEFNGRPDVRLPIGAEQGDDQDEWSFLFGVLVDDARRRGLPQEEFYSLSDEMITFSLECQGYPEMLEALHSGTISRVRFAHEIWRAMPDYFYAHLAAAVGVMLDR